MIGALALILQLAELLVEHQRVLLLCLLLLAQPLQFSPYPYLCYFPVSVYLGHLTRADLWRGFAIQGTWVVLAYGLARLVWSRGIRKYAAVGG